MARGDITPGVHGAPAHLSTPGPPLPTVSRHTRLLSGPRHHPVYSLLGHGVLVLSAWNAPPWRQGGPLLTFHFMTSPFREASAASLSDPQSTPASAVQPVPSLHSPRPELKPLIRPLIPCLFFRHETVSSMRAGTCALESKAVWLVVGTQ